MSEGLNQMRVLRMPHLHSPLRFQGQYRDEQAGGHTLRLTLGRPRERLHAQQLANALGAGVSAPNNVLKTGHLGGGDISA
jgi:hypothetical protein